MVHISLVEIKGNKTRSTSRDTLAWTSSIPRSFSYVVSNYKPEFNVGVKDVTNQIEAGKYSFKTKYSIIYIYDIYSDTTSQNFLRTYGGKLHNESSANITILTYFDEFTMSRWRNVQQREKIGYDPDCDTTKIEMITEQLKHIYEITNLPAMIIRKQENDGEESCVLDLTGYSIDSLYNIFKNVMGTINDYCEEDFDLLKNSIIGQSVEKVLKGNYFDTFNTYNYIGTLVKKKQHYRLDDLAGELSIDTKTLYNKRVNDSFTRDECIYIGIKFQISIDDLNKLLGKCGHQILGYKDRDGIIYRCIQNEYNIDTVDEELRRNHFPILSKIKE